MLTLTKSCFLTVVLPLFCMATYAQSTDRTVREIVKLSPPDILLSAVEGNSNLIRISAPQSLLFAVTGLPFSFSSRMNPSPLTRK